MEYHSKIIDFFRRHNMYDPEVFEYLKTNSSGVDYRDPDARYLIGCFYVKDIKNERLLDLKLVLPYVTDDITALININEITHGIENYPKRGKKFKKDITIEALPLLYEKLYILENPSEALLAYARELDQRIEESSAREYKFALKIREELLKNYSGDMKKSEKEVKRAVRRFH